MPDMKQQNGGRKWHQRKSVDISRERAAQMTRQIVTYWAEEFAETFCGEISWALMCTMAAWYINGSSVCSSKYCAKFFFSSGVERILKSKCVRWKKTGKTCLSTMISD